MSRFYDKITGRLETVMEKIERLQGLDELNAKQQAKLDRLYAKQERLEDRIDEISDTYSLGIAGWSEAEGQLNFSFAVGDSAKDPTFSAGDELIMRVEGVRTKANGGTERKTQTSTFANGYYWDNDNTFNFIEGGGPVLENFDAFDEITVSIATTPGDLKWDSENVLASQSFDISWYDANASFI